MRVFLLAVFAAMPSAGAAYMLREPPNVSVGNISDWEDIRSAEAQAQVDRLRGHLTGPFLIRSVDDRRD